METKSPYFSIEPHAIRIKRRANRDGGGRAQMVRIQRHADAVIDREDEGFVALSPVLDHGNVRRRSSRYHQNPWLGSLRDRHENENSSKNPKKYQIL